MAPLMLATHWIVWGLCWVNQWWHEDKSIDRDLVNCPMLGQLVTRVIPTTAVPCLMEGEAQVLKTCAADRFQRRMHLPNFACTCLTRWPWRLRQRRPEVWKSIPRFSAHLTVAMPILFMDGLIFALAMREETSASDLASFSNDHGLRDLETCIWSAPSDLSSTASEIATASEFAAPPVGPDTKVNTSSA